ncbi:hypothetical protein M3J09_006073 [Ascochyta lentis]
MLTVIVKTLQKFQQQQDEKLPGVSGNPVRWDPA